MEKFIDIQIEIARNTVLSMIGAMLSDAMHTYEIDSVLLMKNDKINFIQKCLDMVRNTSEINTHFSERIISLSEKVKHATAVLIIGQKKFASPRDIDCGLCGFSSCEEYQSFFKEKNKKKKPLCTVEYMSFSSALSKGIVTASQLSISTMIAQSLGIAALKLNIIDADFAMGVILEVGQSVKTGKENKMDINLNSV